MWCFSSPTKKSRRQHLNQLRIAIANYQSKEPKLFQEIFQSVTEIFRQKRADEQKEDSPLPYDLVKIVQEFKEVEQDKYLKDIEILIVKEGFRKKLFTLDNNPYSMVNAHKAIFENSPVDYSDKDNTTCVVSAISRDPADPKPHITSRDGNNKFEEVLNIKPVAVLSQAMANRLEGDAVFLCTGKHVLNTQIFKSISMVGIDSMIPLEIKLTIGMMGKGVGFHLENLKIDFSDTPGCRMIKIPEGSKLSLKNCVLNVESGAILVAKGGSLIVKDCIFYGGYSYPGIKAIHGAQMVEIRDSVFVNFGLHGWWADKDRQTACIQLREDHKADNESNSAIKLTCIGNVFQNHPCYPIGVHFESEPISSANYSSYLETAERTESHKLEQNAVRKNTIKGVVEIMHDLNDYANKIHHVTPNLQQNQENQEQEEEKGDN